MKTNTRITALMLCAWGLAYIEQWFAAQLYLIAALFDAGFETRE